MFRDRSPCLLAAHRQAGAGGIDRILSHLCGAPRCGRRVCTTIVGRKDLAVACTTSKTILTASADPSSEATTTPSPSRCTGPMPSFSFGGGKGASSAMEQLVSELKLHYKDLAGLVVGSEIVDEHHLS